MPPLRRILMLGFVAAAAILLAVPVSANLIPRDVMVMDYQGTLGGTIQISSNDGRSHEDVYAGPSQFNICDATTSGGTVGKGNLKPTMRSMFCDSASYNLVTSYPAVELSPSDVQGGDDHLYGFEKNGKLKFPATAMDTYQDMSTPLQSYKVRPGCSEAHSEVNPNCDRHRQHYERKPPTPVPEPGTLLLLGAGLAGLAGLASWRRRG